MGLSICLRVLDFDRLDNAFGETGRAIGLPDCILHAADHDLAFGGIVGLNAAGKAERVEHCK